MKKSKATVLKCDYPECGKPLPALPYYALGKRYHSKDCQRLAIDAYFDAHKVKVDAPVVEKYQGA